MMNTNNIKRFIGLIGFLLISQMALAQPTITVHYDGSADFGAGHVGYGTGSIWPNPTHPGNPSVLQSVGVGGDSFTSKNHYNFLDDDGSFNAFCVDIKHYLSTGTTTYKLGGEPQLNSIFGTARIDDLQALANQRYSSVHDKLSSAAFQLATWVILFGTPDHSGTYHLNSSTFKTSKQITGGTLAQSWLNDLETANNTGNFSIIYLYGANHVSQNLVVFAPVPEPSTYAMLLGGLGIVWWVRRKKTAENSNASLQYA